MKDKLRQVLAKLAPLIEKIRPKLDPVLQRLAVVKPFLFKTKKLLKTAAIVFFSLFLLATGVSTFLVSRIDQKDLELLLTEQIQASFSPTKIEIADSQWSVSMSSLSFGFRVSDLSWYAGRGLRDARLKSVKLVFSPLRYLKGQAPWLVEIVGGRVLLASWNDSSATAQGNEAGAAERSIAARFPWLSKMNHLQVSFRDLTIDGELSAGGSEQTASPVNDKNVDGQPVLGMSEATGTLEFSLGQGPLSWDVRGNLGSEIAGWNLRGGLHLVGSGYTQSAGGRFVGIKIEQNRIDLTQTQVDWARFIHKPIGRELLVEAPAQIIFRDDGRIKQIDFASGQLSYQGHVVQVKSVYGFELDNFELSWGIGPVDLRQVLLPVRAIDHVPVDGQFESAGSYQKNRGGERGTWRMVINHFRASLGDFAPLLDKESTGKAFLSFVTEGSWTEKALSSGRAELQLSLTDGQVEIAKSQFIKPAGDRLEMLLKMSAKDSVVKTDEFFVDVNNMRVEGRGEWKNFFGGIFKGSESRANVDLRTNEIDLIKWSSYVPWFRKIPLQGHAQLLVNIDLPLVGRAPQWSAAKWRLDRAALHRVRGAFDRQSFVDMGHSSENLSLNGPFEFDFLASGRGQGTNVSRGRAASVFDMTNVAVMYQGLFKKPEGSRLQGAFSAEQSENQFRLRKGRLAIADIDIEIEGDIKKGSTRSKLALRTKKPIDVKTLRQFFVRSATSNLMSGQIRLDGSMGFPSSEFAEGNLDWREFAVTGEAILEDLRFPWGGGQKGVIERLNGRVVVGRDRLDFSGVELTHMGQSFKLEGVLRPRWKRSAGVGNMDFLLFPSRPYDLKAKVTTQLLNQDVLDGLLSGGGQRFWDQYLGSPSQRDSRWQLDVAAKKVNWFDFYGEDFSSRVTWDGRFVKASDLAVKKTAQKTRPVSTNTSSVKGSWDIDLAPYLSRGEEPEFTSRFSINKMKFGNWPWVARSAMLDGLVADGEMRWSAHGHTWTDWVSKGRTRFLGLINGESVGKALDATSRELTALSAGPAPRENLKTRIKPDACFGQHRGIQVDAVFENNGFRSPLFEWRFGSGTVMGGELATQNDVLRLAGILRLNKSCIDEDVQSCLEETLGSAALPIEVLVGSGESQVKWRTANPGQVLSECVDRRIAASPRSAIEIESRVQDVRDALNPLKK